MSSEPPAIEQIARERDEATECVSRCLLEIECLNADLAAERTLADDIYPILDRAAAQPGVALVLGRLDIDAWLARYREARQR